MPSQSSGLNRRTASRVEVSDLVYVTIPQGNPAIILNLAEGGMAIQAMEIQQPGQTVEFAISLPEKEIELKGRAEVVWSDNSGRAGLKFARVSDSDHFQLRQWLSHKVN